MKLILHLMKKDFRRMQLHLLLYFVFLLVFYLLLFYISSRETLAETGQVVNLVEIMHFMLLPLTAAFITVLVIHQDRPTGSTASWLTRPISGPTLLVSKLLFLCIFLIAIPLLMETLWLVLNGALAGHMCVALAAAALERLAFLLPLAALAAVSLNFSFMLAYAIPFTLLNDGLVWAPMLEKINAPGISILQSRLLIYFVLLIVCSGIVVTHQFLTRKTIRSSAMTILAILLIAATWNAWDTDILNAPLPLLDKNHPTVREISVFPNPYIKSSGPTFRAKQNPGIRTYFHVYGLPGNGAVRISRLTGIRLQAGGGEDVPLSTAAIRVNTYLTNSIRSYVSRTFPPAATKNSPRLRDVSGRENILLVNLFHHLDVEELRKNEKVRGPLTYSAQAEVELARFQIVGRLSLDGGRFKKGSTTFRAMGVELLGNRRKRMKVYLNRQTVTTLLTGPVDRGRAAMRRQSNHSNYWYAILDKKNDHVLVSDKSSGTDVHLSALTVTYSEILFPLDEVLNDVDDEWLRQAQLVLIEAVDEARFIKHVTIEGVQIPLPGRGVRGETDDRLLQVLKRIRLPDNPTDRQVRDYILKISAVGFPLYFETGPLIQKLTEVGPEHLTILLDIGTQLERSCAFFISEAVGHLAGPEHKSLILEHLAAFPGLIEIVNRQGWTGEAKKIILDRFQKNPARLPGEWIETIIGFRDPSTYPLLENYFLSKPPYALHRVYDRANRLPGLDLYDAVEAIWNKMTLHRGYTYAGKRLPLLIMALEWGQTEALDIAAALLSGREMSAEDEKALWQVFLRTTGYKGEKSKVREWVNSNRKRFSFDKTKKRWLTGKK